MLCKQWKIFTKETCLFSWNTMERQHNSIDQHRREECQFSPYILLKYRRPRRHCLLFRMVTMVHHCRDGPLSVLLWFLSTSFFGGMTRLLPQLKRSLKLLIFQFLQPPSARTPQYVPSAHPCDSVTAAPQPTVASSHCLGRKFFLFTFNSCKK